MFDLDDTLIDNVVDYNRAKAKFMLWMYDLHSNAPRPGELCNRIDTKGESLVKEYGFTTRRFPETLKRVYEEWCAEADHDAAAAQEAYDIGREVFDKDIWKGRGLVAGAKETLDHLQERGDELLLLTKGEYEIQAQKVWDLGLSKWFGEWCMSIPNVDSTILDARVLIVPHKHVPMYRHVLNGRDPANVWMVGNSLRSDIEPAISVGCRAVYIPVETWVYEKGAEDTQDHERVTTLENIGQIAEKYEEL
mgnify:FL=1